MTSHDVRRLKSCVICGEIGIHHPSDSSIRLPLVVDISDSAEQYAHPNCYLRQYGIEALRSLEWQELRNIRLCDVSPETMNEILRPKRPKEPKTK